METLARLQYIEKALAEETEFEHVVWPYRLVVPVLFLTGAYVQLKKSVCRFFLNKKEPKTNVWFVDGVSINSRRVKEGAARWSALDTVYRFRGGEGSNMLVRTIDSYWLHIRNAQAVRNRLKIVEHELTKAVLKISEARKVSSDPIRILSLAAGSGQAVIDVVSKLQKHGIKFDVVLLDKDESALQYARDLSVQRGLEGCVDAREADVAYFERHLDGFVPDIVEMCGLMDYLPDRNAIVIIKKIHRRLRVEGFFLTCHVHRNWERYFLWWVVNWGMLYRSRSELRDLLTAGGFLTADLYTEPHRIHSVAVTQKL